MNAYDKAYLEDAMSNLAVMLDYGSMAYQSSSVAAGPYTLLECQV